jgi:pimeloyl-ACP methyl ester carboxylesterase
MRRITGDGVELSVLDEGEGPTVLLLHGFPDSSRLWRHQIATLTDAGFRAVAPDQRGYGDSDKPQEIDAYGFGHLVADVVAVLDQSGVEKAHVVGHDWGAAVAWACAMMVPQRVDKLVTLSVGHPGAFAERSLEQRRRSWYMLLFQFEEAEDLLRKDDWKLMRQWAASHPEFERAIEDLRRPGALTAALNCYRASLHPRTELRAGGTRSLPPVTADTLGIFSTGDAFLVEEQMTGSAPHVAGSWRYERIEGAGHWMQLEQPERISALLIDFLK